MMIAIFPTLLALVGLLIWFLSTNAKIADAGRIAFFCGLLVMTWILARHVIRIG